MFTSSVRDRWRHVTLKGQTRDPNNAVRAQYLLELLFIATIARQLTCCEAVRSAILATAWLLVLTVESIAWRRETHWILHSALYIVIIFYFPVDLNDGIDSIFTARCYERGIATVVCVRPSVRLRYVTYVHAQAVSPRQDGYCWSWSPKPNISTITLPCVWVLQTR